MDSIIVWKQALSFHAKNFRHLAPIFPFLFIPIVSDALHTILIVQQGEERAKQKWQSVLQAFQHAPMLLGMKLYFWIAAVLWGFVPIYGWIRDIKCRLAWGMASNVLILEGGKDHAAIARCYELIEKCGNGLVIRALVTIPSFVAFFLVCVWTIPSTLLYWTSLVLGYWVSVPVSAAVNTYCYVRLRGPE